MSEAGGEAAGGGGRGADTELKTKTPHVNVGKNISYVHQSIKTYKTENPAARQRRFDIGYLLAMEKKTYGC